MCLSLMIYPDKHCIGTHLNAGNLWSLQYIWTSAVASVFWNEKRLSSGPNYIAYMQTVLDKQPKFS